MNAIPAGVESALLDAGFSSTEVLVLQRLMEHDALTLRELAGRTGRSTGVLDLAVKKLLQKGIIRKQFINAHIKLSIVSLESILQWMENDIKRKRELMARRHQNFETFIRSLEQDKKRPDIRFFDGLEGLAKAYRMLLICGRKEMLGYVPVFCAIEDHPLRDFMTEWFRQRRKRGVFSRIITHDNPLGRRHQSRDIFEYRKSILIPEAQYPFTFEKYICGDTVACFNYVEKRACLLHYPELAAMERGLFEGIWREHAKKDVAAASIRLSADGGSLVATPPTAASEPSFQIRFRLAAFNRSPLMEFWKLLRIEERGSRVLSFFLSFL